jgi:hypothetical protein
MWLRCSTEIAVSGEEEAVTAVGHERMLGSMTMIEETTGVLIYVILFSHSFRTDMASYFRSTPFVLGC